MMQQMQLEQQETKELIKLAQTEKKPMSEANLGFATALLSGRLLSCKATVENGDAGENYEFSWQGGEEVRTPEAVLQLRELMDYSYPYDGDAEFVDAHRDFLTTLRGGGKESSGKTDIIIRLATSMAFEDSKYCDALGAVELKTSGSDIRLSQLKLELVALSLMSELCYQGVVILGTDLCKKWVLGQFEQHNRLTFTKYRHGSVALRDFKAALSSAQNRGAALRDAAVAASLSSVPEQHAAGAAGAAAAAAAAAADSEQDLDGVLPAAELAAFQREQFLFSYAAALNRGTDAGVVVPSWALDSSRAEFPPEMTFAARGMYA
jgi:hypothetical protein